MATTVTGKLTKPANQFQAGESTGFGIRLGVKYRDPKTKEDAWTNYSAVIFAKSAGQIQFYQSALVENSVVEVSCDQLKVDSYTNDSGTLLSIDMLNARLGYVHTQQGAPQQQNSNQGFQQQNNGGFQQQSAPQQGGFQQQNAPQQGGYQQVNNNQNNASNHAPQNHPQGGYNQNQQ